ncbi:hypothetical protein QBC36DRAFT_370053 [Triangularia setosa]|uniref:Uncharacterized protein n=1 Tax=Triangularia setosa TaxID=2587417 RepID=A0AAN7ACN6_9PEZI|nr:hypothetical protein QBC36DRAFT_370053 [Podospora setosa]
MGISAEEGDGETVGASQAGETDATSLWVEEQRGLMLRKQFRHPSLPPAEQRLDPCHSPLSEQHPSFELGSTSVQGGGVFQERASREDKQVASMKMLTGCLNLDGSAALLGYYDYAATKITAVAANANGERDRDGDDGDRSLEQMVLISVPGVARAQADLLVLDARSWVPFLRSIDDWLQSRELETGWELWAGARRSCALQKSIPRDGLWQV